MTPRNFALYEKLGVPMLLLFLVSFHTSVHAPISLFCEAAFHVLGVLYVLHSYIKHSVAMIYLFPNFLLPCTPS